jgi:hypothetical protein
MYFQNTPNFCFSSFPKIELASGDFSAPNIFKTAFLVPKNPLMPIFLQIELKQKLGVF